METETLTGIDLARQGMEQSYNASSPSWKEEVAQSIRRVATKKATFTADDIWSDLQFHSITTPSKSALGSALLKAVHNRVIASTGTFKRSERPETHCRPLPVWKSLLTEKVIGEY